MARSQPAASSRRNLRQDRWNVRTAFCHSASVNGSRSPGVVDRDAAPSDLQFLTDENIAEIGTALVQIDVDITFNAVLCEQVRR